MPAKSAPNKSESAKKRVRQTKKITLKNRAVKSLIKTLTKQVESDVIKKDSEAAKTSLNKVTKIIDKARTKGIIHKNTAARQVSQLTRRVNSLAQSGAA